MAEVATFDGYLPSCSGAPGSLLDRSMLDFEGRRFLGSALSGADIKRVTGRPAQDPVRVYVGTRHVAGASTSGAEMALAELVRLGGADRLFVLVGSPTGMGWVNHVALRALELLSGGDCASVAVQWGDQRSIRSGRRVEHARSVLRCLLGELHGSGIERTRILVYGESMGAWVLAGLVPELRVLVPGGVALVGTPGVAPFPRADFQQLQAAGTRVVTDVRIDDPVARFPGVSLALRRGQWQGRWLPLVSLLRARDVLDRATRAVPRTVPASAHDYRDRVAAVVADLAGLDPGSERIESCSSWLVSQERERSTWHLAYGPAPYACWPELGPQDACGG